MNASVSSLVPSQPAALLPGGLPIVVDLDALIRCDLVAESFFATLGRDPVAVFGMVRAALRGKAAWKALLCDRMELDPAVLPYDPAALALIQSARQEGREVYIVSEYDDRLVGPIADHLGVLNAKTGHVPGLPSSVSPTDGGIAPGGRDRPSVGPWLALLRMHQYVKNALVFVPLVTSHRFTFDAIATCVLAFVAFSLCASAVYIVNDLVDVEADRHHPKKRNRPLASGMVPTWPAAALSLALLAAAAAIGLSISGPFAGALAGYFTLTTAYTFVLKRKMLVDVVVLSLLYSARVIAGGIAISVPVSEWLLAFSMFIFTTLALLKRYVELTRRLDAGLADPGNRNYKVGDIGVVAALAAAAGFNAVTVFALYISSDAARQLYAHPQVLWLICPLLMYWIGRALLMAHRRHMDDDPIVFAIKDRPSLIVLGLVGALVLTATWPAGSAPARLPPSRLGGASVGLEPHVR